MKIIPSYEKELKAIESFQEQVLDGGKIEEITKPYVKQFEHANRLYLDQNLAKKVENNREDFEKELLARVKKSLGNVRIAEFAYDRFIRMKKLCLKLKRI